MRMGKWQLSVLFVAGTIAVALAGGCTRSTRGQTIAIDGIKLSQDYPTVVEVENWNGSVTVRAVPGLKAPKSAPGCTPRVGCPQAGGDVG
jgi:hypothetical protein